MIGWEAAISSLLVVGIFVGGLILKRLEAMEKWHLEVSKQVERKMDKEACEKQAIHCERTFGQGLTNEAKELWDALAAHSHTGLPSDSRVTR